MTYVLYANRFSRLLELAQNLAVLGSQPTALLASSARSRATRGMSCRERGILIAQSIGEKPPLVTADPAFERYPIDVIWSRM
jgi:PIN domain nuclease of toxin-antitoxin system